MSLAVPMWGTVRCQQRWKSRAAAGIERVDRKLAASHVKKAIAAAAAVAVDDVVVDTDQPGKWIEQ